MQLKHQQLIDQQKLCQNFIILSNQEYQYH
jgi:hypothetical protein